MLGPEARIILQQAAPRYNLTDRGVLNPEKSMQITSDSPLSEMPPQGNGEMLHLGPPGQMIHNDQSDEQ